MNIVERFLDYVRFDTQSSEESDTTPSTPKQMRFAQYLCEQLRAIGLADVYLDPYGYLYATLPSNVEHPCPTIGFISHYDTSPDASGENVRPRIVKNYDGGPIVLGESGRVTDPQTFPELRQHIGEDLIVTDGTTLLGADDKAGIAEIVDAMVYLLDHPEIAHGKVRIAFNPDEEIGRGAEKFDVKRFGAEWAYTMDGGECGELEFENFNAASAKVYIKGVSVHPGSAKGKMRNACRIAAEFVAALPADETPETTEGYEGFFHCLSVQASCEAAQLSYIIRDHDAKKFAQRKLLFETLAERFNAKYGADTLRITLHDQYYNMREKIEPVYHIIDTAVKAMDMAQVRPTIKAIRGGTDGAQLSFMGLPCPNIFAGGLNFHGPHEFLPICHLAKARQVIVNICQLVAQEA